MMLKCQFHGGRTGDDGLLIFCGAPSKIPSSYCAEHHPRIWLKEAAARAARDPKHPARLLSRKRGGANG